MANKDIEHYSYRIEFQVRGLPHLHGVFWLTKDAVKEYQNDNGDFLDKKYLNLLMSGLAAHWTPVMRN